MDKKKYVLVGLGGRSLIFKDAFLKLNKDSVRLLAICDNNKGRLNLGFNQLKAANTDLAKYLSNDFDKMIAKHKPDTVIVCTKDSTHDYYICRAMQLGCDVITEKPMTTDESKCQRIIDTCNETGKTVRVTFNYRYSPVRTQVKELLMSGVIGKILSVNFQWLLDIRHGADYFRRWHRNKENSGGLMVHKSTHHFDLVNWWLSTYPESVFAKGKRVFYTEKQAQRYGLDKHNKRCHGCQVSAKCNFFLDMANTDNLRELYFDNERYDSYFRDKCVFDHQDSDIEDVMNVIVEYNSGALLSYSLNAFMPWEGYRVEFNGTRGRLEHFCQEASYINGDGTVQGKFKEDATTIKIFPNFQTPYEVKVRKGEGGHGGGDEVMLEDIFSKNNNDPLMRSANQIQGAYSILTGIAANKSMASGKQIFIRELISGLEEPEFTIMPSEDEKIEYIPKAQRQCHD